MEELWNSILCNQVGANQSPLNLKENRERMTEIIFEKFNAVGRIGYL